MGPRFMRFSLMALAALLAGCTAVGPNYHAPASPAPSSWQDWRSGSRDGESAATIDTAPLSAQWWTLFDDVTLNALQVRAAQASPDLRSAALRYAQSRTQRLTVAAQRGPVVNATGAATRQRQSEYSAGTRLADAVAPANREELVSVLSQPYTLYQGGFDASWEPDLWGRVRRAIESADASVDNAAALLDQVRLAVASELARDYFELRLAQQQRQLLDQDIAAARDSLSLLQARAQGGLVDDLDVSRQRTQLADLQSRMPDLRAREAALMNQIGLLVDARPGELTAMLATAPTATVADMPAALPAKLPDLSLGVPSDVALQRPDIRAAAARLHAATAEIGVAVADLYPRITLGATFGFESYEGSRFGEWGTRSWQIGPSLILPIFDQGRRRATIVLRELVQQEAAVAYQRTVLQAWQEIDDALTGYDAERARNMRLREKATASRQAYELAQARYAGGLTDFLVQLDAERSYLQARRDLSDSNHQLFVRLIAIYKSVGGGSPEALQAQTVLPQATPGRSGAPDTTAARAAAGASSGPPATP
ncbi:RND transporter [Bordetella flabilis]|uniref:RND transporter n=2 Tax=Bordetella flabilis TaxID=463014 RepID=A0A193G884_9BORD|nr:efflux transporter outer membrane subunit [Bordetella flabilis]ANN76197.1 RND transporter [Bordetella flabilis]